MTTPPDAPRRHRTVALIVAAGKGERAGGDVPKQYALVGGKAVLAHAIDALAAHPAIDAVQVVIGEDQQSLYATAIGARALPPPVVGGATRRDSVLAGLSAISADRVLIHDAARPFVPLAVIDRLLAALDDTAGAVPALPVVDSLARAGAALGDSVERAGVVRVQTPQAFPLDVIRAAHAARPGAHEATDDAQVARGAGHAVAIVEGDALLEKLTHAADLAAAGARLARAMVSRTAMGFDVHAFAEGDTVRIGGISIPHCRGLSGHSDADVVLHALTDALLGTIGAGDIGSHFPPSDTRWRGADSAIFLQYARDLIGEAGGMIDHVDVTIICEAPKIGPHRQAMRDRIAALLRLHSGQVSVKATTTERLGFTGRSEGIAAQAMATVRLNVGLGEQE